MELNIPAPDLRHLAFGRLAVHADNAAVHTFVWTKAPLKQ